MLFVVMLGGKHPRAKIEVHDVVFAVADSLEATWALLLTSAILYIPANLLPIMTVNSLGQGSPSTIMACGCNWG